MTLHSLLKSQFEDSRLPTGGLDLRKLLQAISAAYTEWDEERRGVVRSMKLPLDSSFGVSSRPPWSTDRDPTVSW